MKPGTPVHNEVRTIGIERECQNTCLIPIPPFISLSFSLVCKLSHPSRSGIMSGDGELVGDLTGASMR